MAYYKMKEQLSVMSATVNQLTMEKSRLLEEKDQVSSKFGRMNKLEEAERENSYSLLKEKYDKLLEDLKNMKIENKTLQNKMLILETEGGAARADNSRIQEIINEKNMLQNKLDDLLQLPFFKREAGKSTYQENQTLRQQIKEKESEYKNVGDKIKALETENGKLKDDLKILSAERDNLKSMNNSFKNRLMDGPGMNMQEMMNNLLQIDPNEFRRTMHDLEFDG